MATTQFNDQRPASAAECATLPNLLAGERHYFSKYWHAINAMRDRDELPAWLVEQHPDLGLDEEFWARNRATHETDRAIKGDAVAAKYDVGYERGTFFLMQRGGIPLWSGRPSSFPRSMSNILKELTPFQLAVFADSLKQETYHATIRDRLKERLQRQRCKRSPKAAKRG